METQFVFINSHTSGNVHIESIGGREHIVTKMVSIVGNTVMNNIFYPNDEVVNSMHQLDMIKAPIGHPKVNGVNVSISHPVGDNIHNVGAFVRSPRMEGMKVINDLCIDVERANQSDNGKELVRRINAGEHVGVSTGLNLQIENISGTGDDGVAFERIGRNFQFDHVAVLLNEASAGEHVGTAVVNAYGGKMIINEINVLTLEDRIDTLLRDENPDMSVSVWSIAIFTESKTFIYRIRRDGFPVRLFRRGYSIDSDDNVTLLDDAVEVRKKVEFVPIGGTSATNTETPEMAPKANKVDPTVNTDAGQSAPVVKTPKDDGDGLTANAILEGAKTHGLTVINQEDAALLSEYKINKPALDSLAAAHNTKIAERRTEVAKHHGFNEEVTKSLTEEVVNHMYEKIVPSQDYSLGAGGNVANGQKTEDKSFFINHDEDEKGESS